MKNGKNYSKQKTLALDQNRKFAVRLLMTQVEHGKKLDRLEEAGIDADKLRVDLLTIALDLLGVPTDNTVELQNLYGQDAWTLPEHYCRDCFSERWHKAEKTQKGISDYVDWVLEQLETPARN